jgi:hypothetical protein
MSRTPETETYYAQLARTLLDRQGDWKADPLDAARRITLQGETSSWSKATWRIYRAALHYYLESSGYQEAADWIRYARPEFTMTREARTSQKKQKGLAPEEADALTAALAASTSRYARAARIWLQAGILTGLRPSEWREAHFDPEAEILTVMNAKATNGRGNGPMRRLRLRNLTRGEREVIQEMIRVVQEHADFRKLYGGVRKVLFMAARRVWPRRKLRISLYSSRHQWVANAKRVYDRRTVAALAGHASAETAGHHYARRRRGRPANLPEPDEKTLAAVRKEARIRPGVVQETVPDDAG